MYGERMPKKKRMLEGRLYVEVGWRNICRGKDKNLDGVIYDLASMGIRWWRGREENREA